MYSLSVERSDKRVPEPLLELVPASFDGVQFGENGKYYNSGSSPRTPALP
jgi:hypothetical protein